MRYDLAIKQLREKMLVSQEELAKTLGVSVVTVSRWETGKFIPTIKIRRKLKELFLQYSISTED
ncbi:MAG TPA: helix-turn-helix transcriptional regulator [Bacilli bacterium]|nr:helix-turn-helix transcriptional regulator [Bacilli bacterium]HQD92263.1 helix-turn-helix transcriptional regulator [Bacilli bacterium]